MIETPPSYRRHRFPAQIISHGVWLYYRFILSFRDVEDLLAERGITVSYEAIRGWCGKFGGLYGRRLKRREGRLGDVWHLDEMFVRVQGRQQYLWRAVDQDGDVIDILVQPRRDARAAKRFFRKLLKGQQQEPIRLVTDKLKSYSAAHREIMPSVPHDTSRWRTTALRSLMRRSDSESARCESSNHLGTHSDSSRYTASSGISFESVARESAQLRIASFALARSGSGSR